MQHLLADGLFDGAGIMRHVDDIRPALARDLPVADVHRWHAEEGTFANGHGRIADDAFRAQQHLVEGLRRHVAEEVHLLKPPFLAPHADGLGGGIRPGIHVGPEPQGGHAKPGDGLQRRFRLLVGLFVFRRYRVLHHHDEVFVVNVELRPHPAEALKEVLRQRRVLPRPRRDVDGRAAGQIHAVRVLAHGDDVIPRAGRGHQVHIGQLGNGMAHAVVDVAGYLAALDVGQRDVHVAGGNGGGDGLEAVGNAHHHVGLQVLQCGGRLVQPQRGGLRLRYQVLALQDGVDAPGDVEAVRLHHLHHLAIAVQQGGGGGDDLQLHVIARAQRLKCGAHPRIGGPRRNHHAHLALLLRGRGAHA